MAKEKTIKILTKQSDKGLLSRVTGIFSEAGVSLTITIAEESPSGGAIFRFGFKEAKDGVIIQGTMEKLRKMPEVESVE